MSPELAQWKQAIETVLEIVESFDYERIAKYISEYSKR